MNPPAYAPAAIADSVQRTISSDQLVAIRNPEKGSPLFCIHPSGGDIGIYRKLATRLGSSRSILGIQSRLESGASTEHASIDAMADQYTQIIDQQQPDGSIRLLGFSLGGFVASLIARNFHQMGRRVSFLGLIDSNPSWTIASETSHRQLCKRLTQVFVKFQSIGVMRQKPIETVERDVAQLVDFCLGNQFSPDKILAKTIAKGYVPERQVDSGVLAKFTSTFLAHSRLLKDFQPPFIDCPLHLWWPSETENENQSGTKIWSGQTTCEVSQSVIEGSHYTIMRGTAVRVLAAEVETAISESEI